MAKFGSFKSNKTKKQIILKNRLLAKLICTLFFAGYFPLAPGTFGSLIILVIIWFLIPPFFYILLSVSIVLFFISVWSASKGEEFFGKDGRQIVTDEVTGMSISLLFVPKEIRWYILAFFLFRIFDIIKPPPARRMEKLKHGWGVTLDDVVAGIYANVSLHMIYFIRYLMQR
ncbi:MAG: phosphatidylglycerophosphatase A [Candidatus Zixiibacteriota bacterium]